MKTLTETRHRSGSGPNETPAVQVNLVKTNPPKLTKEEPMLRKLKNRARQDIADPSHAADDLVEDVARWEDEGGAVVFE